jgi:hypothetical protein
MGRGFVVTYGTPAKPLSGLVSRPYDPGSWIFHTESTRLHLLTVTGVIGVNAIGDGLWARREGQPVSVVYADPAKTSVRLYVHGRHRYVRVRQTGEVVFTIFKRMGTLFAVRPVSAIDCEHPCWRRLLCTIQ